MNLPNLPFAVFDEFGKSCDDRVGDHYYRSALAAQPGAVPADCDVRKIMLDVVPGWDGEGVEVYAKSVAEVEAKLGEIWAELEEWQMGIRKLAAAPTEAKPAQDAVGATIPLDKEELAQLIASMLYGTYHCTRVWEAWNVGTMSRDDFEPVDESETPTEIADAIIAAIRAAISAKKGGAA